jgi:DNA-binding beta-propeller fold protein YncE
MSLRNLVLLPLAFAAMASFGASASEPYKIADKIKGADGPWDYAYVDAANNRLLVARGDGVMAVDLATNAVTATFVPGKRVHGIVTTPSGMGVSSNGDSSTATVFKAADGKVVADLPAGAKADAVVRDPKTGLVLVMNSKDGTVLFVDADKGEAAGLLPVGGTLEFAQADSDGHVFVNVEDKNEIVFIDVAKKSVTAHHPLKDCDGPTGLALDKATHVLVASCGNGKAAAISALDGHALATLPIGKGPDAVMFDEKTRRFLVPCGEGVLTVIEEDAKGGLKVAATVTTERGARTGAVDAKTGKIYLPTAEFGPAEPGKRPAALPGSFHILVLSSN